jgi:hypothetical protein
MSSPSRSICFETNRSSGNCSASKKSGDCRWPARLGSSTRTLATLAVPSRRPSTSLASTSSNVPLNVITPLCLTAKPIVECTGSSAQVLVGRTIC